MAKDSLKEYCTYMEKKAIPNPFSNLWMALTTGSEMTGDAIAAGLAIAALAGGGTGFLASKLSSPGKKDFKNVQRQFLTEKLNNEIADTKRDILTEEARKKSELTAPNPKAKSIRL
jgi:hypothetical protein